MPKFLVLYKADVAAHDKIAQSTPEEQQAGIQAWMTWAQKAGPALVDLGSPLAPACESFDQSVGGFSILEADSKEALQGLLEDHPHTALAVGGAIEAFEFLPIPGA
ncbi:MAG: hypothetical protein ACRC20_09925 [Segniliparus sp.]|uniref:hypothetical protein n=1 Tax=Segniliparus sp. TaxID=2804064 RepID=UPI003F3A57CB